MPGERRGRGSDFRQGAETLPALAANRVPPQNIEAEVSTLGALLLDPEAITKVADFLSPADFYRPDYAAIYQCVLVLFEKHVPIDIVTVAEELEKIKKLEEVGGAASLSSLVSSVASATNVQYYGNIVREKAMLRRLIHAAAQIGDLGFQTDLDTNSIVDKAEQTLFAVTERFLKQNFVPVHSILAESFERLDALSKQDGSLRGVSSGFRHLDSILGGLQQGDLVILAARPSMGKCLTGDSEILDPHTGALVPIERMVRRKRGSLISLKRNWRLGPAEPSAFIENGTKPTFRVRTALGREIETTLVHPYLTVRGWRPLSELKEGDRIAVPRMLPVFGSVVLPDHEVASLAYFIADGALTRSQPTFTNVNPVIIADFHAQVSQFPGVTVRRDDSRGRRASSFMVATDRAWYAAERSAWSALLRRFLGARGLSQAALASAAGVGPSLAGQWASGAALPGSKVADRLHARFLGFPLPSRMDNENPVTGLLRQHGIWGKDAHAKSIPDAVLSLPRHQLALFLNRLFACDGTAYVAYTGGKEQPRIAYASVSKPLIRRVQHLLLRFGIIAKLRERSIAYRGTCRPSYELEILESRSLLIFAEEIGILGKERALDEVARIAAARRRGFTHDTVPREVGERLTALKGDRSWAQVAQALGRPASHNFHVGTRALRRETVAELAAYFGDQELLDMASGDVYWDRIVAIEPTGRKPVYDLTVDGDHNFVANDLIVHNTAFALNMAEHAAVRQKKTVGIFSLEMSKEQLVDRLISSIGLIDSWKLRNGKLTDDDFQNLNEAYGLLAEANLFIDDEANATVNEVRAKARRLQAEHGLDLIVIDYLQLMKGSAVYAGDRVQEVSEISRGLKALAKEVGCPVIALSQLSRAVESRPDKRPLLSDLRESGSIEQDADVVMFLYREDYYNKEEQNNIMEVLVRKHRNGPTGDVQVLARLQFSRFETLDLQRMSAGGGE